MDDRQHEHKKDFLVDLLSFRPGAKKDINACETVASCCMPSPNQSAKALVVAAHQKRGVREEASATRPSRVP